MDTTAPRSSSSALHFRGESPPPKRKVIALRPLDSGAAYQASPIQAPPAIHDPYTQLLNHSIPELIQSSSQWIGWFHAPQSLLDAYATARHLLPIPRNHAQVLRNQEHLQNLRVDKHKDIPRFWQEFQDIWRQSHDEQLLRAMLTTLLATLHKNSPKGQSPQDSSPDLQVPQSVPVTQPNPQPATATDASAETSTTDQAKCPPNLKKRSASAPS